MRVADDGQSGEVRPCVCGAFVTDRSGDDEASQRMLELHIEQVRSMQVAVADQTVDELWNLGLARQDADDGRRIDHDHG